MFDFDPRYGYNLDQLLTILPPPEPEGFAEFWRERYQRVLPLNPDVQLTRAVSGHEDFDCYDLRYRSTDDCEIGGWALVPRHQPVQRGLIVGHGYGGRDGPDYTLPIDEAAVLFPCFRGLSRSRRWPISDNPNYHVLHDIDKPGRYILGGCVEDLWLAVTAMLNLFPETFGHIAYMGTSFGGGIGALALPWDARVARAHWCVPSFGNHPLRLRLPTWGSAGALQHYQRQHGPVETILNFYDAAIAAKYCTIPVHVAAALADPVVAPPGQFTIYNALPGDKQLFVLDWGHWEYPQQAAQQHALFLALQEFFKNL